MAKINIQFNGTNYSVDESALASATSELQKHLSSVMHGSGTVVHLGGLSYSVDSAKLSGAVNDLVSHLGAITGNSHKVIINGTEYGISSEKIVNTITELETVFNNLQPNYDYYIEENAAGGETMYVIGINTTLSNVDNEFGGQTTIIN